MLTPAAAGFLDDAVVHIGEVHHLNDAEALRFQIPPQNILKHKRAEISDVREIVDRRPAGVRADFARHQRNKRLGLSRHRIVKPDFRHSWFVHRSSVRVVTLMANAPF